MKKALPYIGIIISLFFLYLTFHNVNFGLMRMHLGHITVPAVAGVFVCNLLFFIIRALYQINNLHYLKAGISFRSSLGAIATAQFYNNLLPARIGDIIRSITLKKQEGLAVASVLSYIIVEKIADMTLMLLLLVVILAIGFQIAGITSIMVISAVILFCITGTLIVFVRCNGWLLSRGLWIMPARLHPLMIRLNSELVSGLQCFRSKRQVFIAIGLLLAGWLMVIGVFYFISLPYLPLLGLPWYACLFFTVFSIFSMSVPSAPAGIGVVHYGLFLAISLLNRTIISTQLDLVAALIIIMHLTSYLVDLILSGGLLLIMRTNCSPHGRSHLKSAGLN